MKRFILLILLILLASPVVAEEETTLSAQELLNEALSDIDQAANDLAEQIGIPINDAKQLLTDITTGSFNEETAINLLDSVIDEELSAELASALSTVEALGELTSINSVEDIFSNPTIATELDKILAESGLPEDVMKAIDDILEIAADPAALLEMGVDELASVIADALPADLLAELGGEEGIATALNSLLEGSSSTAESSELSCGASCDSCKDCAPKINQNHQTIRAHATSEFERHREWLVSTFFMEKIAPAMMLMTNELTTMGLQQVQIIGGFFDAKHQLETQRLFQTLTAETHKDYHPSTGLCEIGTNIRSLAASEKEAQFTQLAFAKRMMDRQNLNSDTISGKGSEKDRLSRLSNFIDKFCNKTDHAGALEKLCEKGGKSPEQINQDIDYTNSFDTALTLEINNLDDLTPTQDEENLYALSANLFANDVLPALSDDVLKDNNGKNIQNLLDIRAIAAKRSIAQNSFAAITALKTEGDGQAAPFLKAILAESGISPEDIEERLGANPSYYAQMEVLTKDIYQNPTFYSNLYDTPANVERKSAGLLALELMQDRDIYKSLLRSEAIIATMVEVLIEEEQDRITSDLLDVKNGTPRLEVSGGGS